MADEGRPGWLFLAPLGFVGAIVIVAAIILRPGPAGTPFYLVPPAGS